MQITMHAEDITGKRLEPHQPAQASPSRSGTHGNRLASRVAIEEEATVVGFFTSQAIDVKRQRDPVSLAAVGAPQLTSAFCRWDENWIRAIDPAKHGVRFERPTTIGLGGAVCPFLFVRVGGPNSDASRS